MKTKISSNDGVSLMKKRNWGEKYEDCWAIVEVSIDVKICWKFEKWMEELIKLKFISLKLFLQKWIFFLKKIKREEQNAWMNCKIKRNVLKVSF